MFFQAARGVIIVLAVLAIRLTVGAAEAQVSTTFQVNAAHSGALITKEPFAPPLKQVWSVDLGGELSFPLVADGMVFVSAEGASQSATHLFALSAKTGAQIWEKYSNGWITYDKGVLFELSRGGVLQAYNAATGALIWIVQIPGELIFSSPPVASDGDLYFLGQQDPQDPGYGGTVFKVAETDGSILWSTPSIGGGAPTVAYGRVYTVNQGGVAAYSAGTGANIWIQGGGSVGFDGTAAVGQGVVAYSYGFTNDSALLNTSNGTFRFAIGEFLPAFSGTLMIQAQNHEVIATNVITGNAAWIFKTPQAMYMPPLVVNGTAYAESDAGEIYAIDIATGALEQTIIPSSKGLMLEFATDIGLAAGQGLLVEPFGSHIIAYAP